MKGKNRSSRKRAVFARDRYACYLCGRVMTLKDDDLTVDHLIPLWAGGTNKIGNLKTCCAKCNMEKARREHPMKLAKKGLKLSDVNEYAR